jgi:hypothetical protein
MKTLTINSADAIWNDTTAREARMNRAASIRTVRAKLATNNKPSIWSRVAAFFDTI